MEDRSKVYRCLHSAAVKRDLFCTSSTDEDVLVIFNFPGVLEKKLNGTHFHRNYANCNWHKFLLVPC